MGGWLAIWMVALALLAVMPGTGAATIGEYGGSGIYYSHGSTNHQYQDLTGTYTVPVRTLRPIFNG